MNRRGFLGFLGIGAAAGPSIAKEAMSGVSTVGMNPRAAISSLNMPTQAVSRYDSGGHIKDLMRRLRGKKHRHEELADEVERVGSRYYLVEENVKALKSVSRTATARISRERLRRHREEHQTADMWADLYRYWFQKRNR